jgi:pyruvate,water dikinase
VERVGERLRTRSMPPVSALPGQRLDFVVDILADVAVDVVPQVMPPVAAGFAMLKVAGTLLGNDAQRADLAAVLRGVPHNVTTDMDLDLWRLATRLRADDAAARAIRTEPATELAGRYLAGTLPPVLQDCLRAFLARYGERAVAEIDLGLPRWSEDPTHVIGVLGNYLRLEDPDRAPDAVFTRGAAQAEAMVATLTDRARRRSALRGRTVGFALDRARQLAGLRELPKYEIVLVLAQARQELMKIGVDLAAAGALREAHDVVFLDLHEVATGLDGGDLRDLVVRRRDTYERELQRRHVPRVLLSDGTEPEAEPASPTVDGALVGVAASYGTVTGPARVVLEPTGARIMPGEILVAPSTDPGWTPLFLTAGGLVMEMGGANSHGAVVAREYGIPAVVGVPHATNRITTGQQVTVDGTHGLVTATAPGS